MEKWLDDAVEIELALSHEFERRAKTQSAMRPTNAFLNKLAKEAKERAESLQELLMFIRSVKIDEIKD